MTTSYPFPLFYAHRGASAYAPENTLAAFETALKQNAPAIEFDVKLTSDSRVIVLHDDTVDRTTNGTGSARGLPLAALRELDAGSWFGEQFRNQPIPTLDDVFETFGQKILMNIELTNYASPFDSLVKQVVNLVKKFNLQDRVLYSSFLPHNLVAVKKLSPTAACGQLALPKNAGWWQRLAGQWMAIEAVHPYYEDVNPQMVINAHTKKRAVQVWTVNDPQEMRRLKKMGVDAIFTDDPLLAHEHFVAEGNTP